ncbi:hypothetical protein [Psychroserpens sp.]|jgi:hypothetical protein
MKRASLILIVISIQFLNAQTNSVATDNPLCKWIQTNKVGLGISEVTFVN